jgi:hypothetical protein
MILRATAPAAAAVVAHAVLGEVAVVGVARPKGGGDLRIVAAALVDVVDDHRNRRAGGDLTRRPFVREDAGEDAHRVRLLALGDELALAGPALLQPLLDVGLGERDAGWAAVDHAAQRGPMAFAPGGDAEQMAERIVRHGRACSGLGGGLQPQGGPIVRPNMIRAICRASKWVGPCGVWRLWHRGSVLRALGLQVDRKS